jgi:hypothetical protein
MDGKTLWSAVTPDTTFPDGLAVVPAVDEEEGRRRAGEALAICPSLKKHYLEWVQAGMPMRQLAHRTRQ